MTERRRRLLMRLAVVLVVLIGGLYLAGRVALSELRYRFYLKELAAFGDPNVTDLRRSAAKEVYRLFYANCLGPRTVITVLARDDNTGVLQMKVPDSNATGAKWRNTSVDLDAAQVGGLRRVVDCNPVWREKPQYYLTIDGAAWYLEVKRGRKYLFSFQRLYPSDRFVKIGRYMLELSDSEFARWLLEGRINARTETRSGQ